jgi:(2Fe-2S) ferredoxin
LGGRVASALYAHASERVHRVSHLGGHRFAAVVVSLPDGMCYGRVAPEHAETLVREHTAGRLYDLAYLRGRSGFDEPSQAAEIAHRRATGIREIDDVLPIAIEKVETGARVVLDVRGEQVTLDVSKETLSIERPASCGEPNTRAITLRALRV